MLSLSLSCRARSPRGWLWACRSASFAVDHAVLGADAIQPRLKGVVGRRTHLRVAQIQPLQIGEVDQRRGQRARQLVAVEVQVCQVL